MHFSRFEEIPSKCADTFMRVFGRCQFDFCLSKSVTIMVIFCNMLGVGDGTWYEWWVTMQVLRISSKIFICFESVRFCWWTLLLVSPGPRSVRLGSQLVCPSWRWCSAQPVNKFKINYKSLSSSFHRQIAFYSPCWSSSSSMVGRRQHFSFYFLYFVSFSSLLTSVPH